MTSGGSLNVDDRRAVNSSPLIYLAHAGFLDLLKLAGAEGVVSDIVAHEINKRGPADATAHAVASTEWIAVVKALPTPPEIQA